MFYQIIGSSSLTWLPFAPVVETVIVRLALTLAFFCLAPVIGIIGLDLGLYIVRLLMWNSTETYGMIKRRLSQPDISTLGPADEIELVLIDRKEQMGSGTGAASFSFATDDDYDEPAWGGEKDSDNLDEDDPIFTWRQPVLARRRINSIVRGQAAMITKKSPSSTHLSGRRSRGNSGVNLVGLARNGHSSGVNLEGRRFLDSGFKLAVSWVEFGQIQGKKKKSVWGWGCNEKVSLKSGSGILVQYLRIMMKQRLSPWRKGFKLFVTERESFSRCLSSADKRGAQEFWNAVWHDCTIKAEDEVLKDQALSCLFTCAWRYLWALSWPACLECCFVYLFLMYYLFQVFFIFTSQKVLNRHEGYGQPFWDIFSLVLLFLGALKNSRRD